jgi:hypothetical protein
MVLILTIGARESFNAGVPAVLAYAISHLFTELDITILARTAFPTLLCADWTCTHWDDRAPSTEGINYPPIPGK